MSLRSRLDRLARSIDVNYCPDCADGPRVELHDADKGPVPPARTCPECGRLPKNLIRIILSTMPDRQPTPDIQGDDRERR